MILEGELILDNTVCDKIVVLGMSKLSYGVRVFLLIKGQALCNCMVAAFPGSA